MSRTWFALAALAASIVGCKASSRPAAPPPRRVVVASFQGTVDAVTGAVRITRATAGASSTGYDEVPVVSDGVPGEGPPDTVELVTEKLPVAPAPQTIAGGCGAYDGFEGWIRLRSFYAGTVLRNAYVEITYLSRAGREACNSAPAPAGLSNATGLFSYGTLGVAGTSVDSAVVPWRFRLPDQSSFSFGGRVVADLVTDTTPPTVASVTPTARQIGVDPATVLSVAFSEPVDPATVTTATFSVTGPDGAVDGTIVADASHQVFTFTPTAPLRAEALYSIAVGTDVRDLAGNALSPAFASTFYTVTAPRAVQGTTSASIQSHDFAFDAYGYGLAAWKVSTVTGNAIVYSTFDPSAGVWTGGRVLDTEIFYSNDAPVRVAADPWTGSFLVAWGSWDGPRAMRFQGGVPIGSIAHIGYGTTKRTWPPDSLSSLVAGSPGPSQFVVAWADQGGVAAWVWDGAAWGQTSVGSGTAPVWSGLALYWIAGDGKSVLGSRYDRGWSSPRTLTTLGTNDGTIASLASANVVVAYGTTVGRVWAGTDFWWGSVAFTDITGDDADTSAPLALAAGAFGDEYTAAWVGASGAAYAAFRSGTTWAPSTQLLAARAIDVSVAGAAGTSGTGLFTAAFTVTDAGTSAASLWTLPSSGVPGARSWDSSQLVGHGDSSVREARVAVSDVATVVHWVDADAAGQAVMLERYDDGVVGARSLLSDPVHGSITGLRAASNGGGEVMAVWTQDDGDTTAVFAALHGPMGWTAPVRLLARASLPDVASNGTGFLITAFAESPTTSSAGQLVAVPYENGAFGALEIVQADVSIADLHVASDGATYAVGWRWVGPFPGPWGTIQGSIRSGGAWQAPSWNDAGGNLAVAGRPGEYLWVWTNGTDVYQQREFLLYGNWYTDAKRITSLAYLGSSVAGVGVAGGPQGFLVSALPSGKAIAWTFVNGAPGIWPAVLEPDNPAGSSWCQEPAVAASGARFLVAWNCAGGLETAETDGVTVTNRTVHLAGWDSIGALVWSPVAQAYAIATDADGRLGLVYESAFDGNTYGRESIAGAWASTTSLGLGSAFPAGSAALAWDGGAWTALWSSSTAIPIVDDLVTRWAW